MGSEWKLPLELEAPRASTISAPLAPTNRCLHPPPIYLLASTLFLTTRGPIYLICLLSSSQVAKEPARPPLPESIVSSLRSAELYHTTYFPCTRLVNDETRVSTIKETINRLFMRASWRCSAGGRAVVILDDLDRLCPAETELQVGNENGRSRQISEAICSIVQQYCGRDSNVALLVTAQGKTLYIMLLLGATSFVRLLS